MEMTATDRWSPKIRESIGVPGDKYARVMAPVDSSPDLVQRVLDHVAASPTPYHAARRAVRRLAEEGFSEVRLDEVLPSEPGRYVTTRAGACLAWIVPDAPIGRFCVVGAHTDSPNLRLRHNAELTSAGWVQLGVEVYGGALLNSWLDRDLGLAGRVLLANPLEPNRIEEKLVLDPDPILRVPQLAIHLDREIREKGLVLDPQQHLTPLWGLDASDGPGLGEYLARLAECGPDEIVSWELMAYDTQAPAVVGRDRDLLASARIDNQLSCFAGVEALAALPAPEEGGGSGAVVPVLALYDHEEVGSASAYGAAGGLLDQFLERVSASRGFARTAHLETLSRSVVVSADGAHATHPNYADRHEPSHQVAVNAGVVVKRNVNQRYATDARTEAWFRRLCAAADVPVQTYIHRNDLPCGSTIGPLTAAELAVPTVDIGAPQLAMHSARELAGTADLDYLVTALGAAWSAQSAH